MDNVELMQVVDTVDDLVKKAACLLLRQSN